MHQPLAIADEEGVISVHREIVHRLLALLMGQHLDLAIAAIGFADMLADLEFARRNPTTLLRVEGMLWCGLDALTVQRDRDHDGIVVGQYRVDAAWLCLACLLVVGQHGLVEPSVH